MARMIQSICAQICNLWLCLALQQQVALGWSAPKISPATGLANQCYTWRQGMKIRYQCDGPIDGPPVLLVHGLFVNSDHWRKTLRFLADEGYRAYAVDLFGCGYSDKPDRDSAIAQDCNGEAKRFDVSSSRLPQMELGTAGGVKVRIADVELKHPLGSPYNFYTWSELLTDFSNQIVLDECKKAKEVTLVCNSIGTISALQAVVDAPETYTGVFVVSPNFRELHEAEVPFSRYAMPVIRKVQALLRNKGQSAYDALTKPDIIKNILREPYGRTEEIDDTLVQVLLDPLLTPGSSQVVFDTLSYSAGPLPEQQLSTFPGKPVWICYGLADPWTPAARVEALQRFPSVEHVEGWDGVGHCPHDEAPELVHPMLLKYLERLELKGGSR